MSHIRYIIVPKNQDAIMALDYDMAKPEQLIEWELSQDEFMELWNLKIFDKINTTCDTIIDDCEDENISEINDLIQCSLMINQMKNKQKSIQKFFIMIQYAIDFQTGIFFYF